MIVKPVAFAVDLRTATPESITSQVWVFVCPFGEATGVITKFWPSNSAVSNRLIRVSCGDPSL